MRSTIAVSSATRSQNFSEVKARVPWGPDNLGPVWLFWSEIDCAGLLSGVMDNTKKYLLASDLEPDQDNGSDMHKKCDR